MKPTQKDFFQDVWDVARLVPYGRVTYDYVDSTKLFVTTAYESNGNEVRGGVVLGIEFILNP